MAHVFMHNKGHNYIYLLMMTDNTIPSRVSRCILPKKSVKAEDREAEYRAEYSPSLSFLPALSSFLPLLLLLLLLS